MKPQNKIFIATSLDGYIADVNGGIEWLETIPELNKVDTGYVGFTASIDALVMGRNTFETVLGFDIEWPYSKPVFVLSNTINAVPEKLKDKVYLVKGTLQEVLQQIHQKGFQQLYIDGGKVIQSFLKEDLIDEMIITVIPILLGNGIPLFGDVPKSMLFDCVESKLFLDRVVQNHFKRNR